VFSRLQRFLILGGVAALAAACDPNVVIGARLSLTESGSGGQVSSAGTESSSGAGGTESSGGAGGTGANASGGTESPQAGAAGDASSAGAGGAPSVEEWCATSPWDGTSAKFDADSGNIIPAGRYVITYVSGAQLHDPDIGYEVTRHYFTAAGLQAGHHLFSGENPETGATSLWLDEVGITGAGGTIAQVEAANRGHTWPLKHAGGELQVVLYDDDYHDNKGPGTRFCVTPATP
jgi:hypothetical protein